MIKKVDTLIVGGGLAGCLLAYEHLKNNKTCIVVDRLEKESSSRVAAGLFNPIVLKKFTKTWQADALFPYLHTFYPELEAFLEQKVYHPTPIAKLFNSFFEQNSWAEASAKEALKPYLSIESIALAPDIKQTHANGSILQSGWVDAKTLVEALQQKLKKQYIAHHLAYESLEISADHAPLKSSALGIEAQRVVFCEGYYGKDNPYFSEIKFEPTQGELLLLHNDSKLKHIVHKGGFVIPMGNGQFKVGTTYNRTLTEHPSTEGLNSILEIANNIFSSPSTLSKHTWGIRPTIYDRMPVLGPHPTIKNMYILNGLGSKGVSLGPFMAQLLFNHLYHKQNIPEELLYARFEKRRLKKE